MTADQQHAHALLDRVPANQISTAVRFLESLLVAQANNASMEDEEISEEEERAVARSKEWFQHNDGIPFKKLASDLGYTMDQIRDHHQDEEKDPAA